MKAIDAGLLIDGSGTTARECARLLIENGRIVRIEEGWGSDLPEGCEYIRAHEQTAMPGLIDCHVHVAFDGSDSSQPVWGQNPITEMLPGTLAYRAYRHALADLHAGFTAIRDMHCFDFVDVSLRDAINAGELDGPRISASGYGLTSTNGHMDPTKGLRPDVAFTGRFNNVVDSADEARKAVRGLIKMDVDHIKINVGRGQRGIQKRLIFAPEMQLDVIQAICDEAHACGRKVAAHSLGGQGERWAVEAGVDSLEHAHFVDEDTLRAMADRGTYLVPTMTHCVRNMRIETQHEKEAPPDRPEEGFMAFAYRSMMSMLEKAIVLGVRIGLGTDAGADHVPHGSNAFELEALMMAGFSPMQALVAATRTGAEILGLEDEIGALAPGKRADLLLVDGNPLKDVRILQESANLRVFKDGKEVQA